MIKSAQRLSSDELLDILSLSHNATAIYTTPDLIIQTANDAMLTFWGKDKTIIGMPLQQAVPELQGQQFIDILKNVWYTGITYEARNIAAEFKIGGIHKTFYFDFIYRAIKNNDGSIYCILHTATDVTQQFANQRIIQQQQIREKVLNDKLANVNHELTLTNQELQQSYNKLTESENRLREILEQAPIGVCVLKGPDMVIELANDVILKTWGRTLQEVIGKPHKIARPELEGQPVNQWLDNVYSTGVTRHNEEFKVRLYHHGELREAYVNSTYQPLKDSQGKITGVLVVLEEITEKVRERQEAERVQQMFNLAIDSAELGTWYIELPSRKFVPSGRLKELFGFHQHEDMPYEASLAQIPDDYRNRVRNEIERVIIQGDHYDIEYPVIGYHDHKLRWVKATGKVYVAINGKPSHFSGTILDITERKLDENRKNDFIAMVSHELKTPLTSTKAYVQMLNIKAKRINDSFTSMALDKVEYQIEKMRILIESFLDIAKIESGKIQLNIQAFSISALLAEAVEDAVFVTQSHEILVNKCDDIMVEADRDKIGQVINNLISNAVKYSPKGKAITLSCNRTNNHIQISVKDEGMGIKPEDTTRLFDRFYRVESKHTKTISGFGIGLYLCAEIVQRHNGQIGVDSELDKGSTFWFTLPLNA